MESRNLIKLFNKISNPEFGDAEFYQMLVQMLEHLGYNYVPVSIWVTNRAKLERYETLQELREAAELHIDSRNYNAGNTVKIIDFEKVMVTEFEDAENEFVSHWEISIVIRRYWEEDKGEHYGILD